MLHKIIESEHLKVSDTGEIDFYASVFGNKDKQGDIVLHGAFDDSIAEWQAKSQPFPLVYGHQYGDPSNIIGSADPSGLTVDAKGFRVTGQLDIADNPQAKWVHTLAKKRVVTGASFAYDIRKKRDLKGGRYDLVTLHALEAGPCLIGANSEAGIIGVKDAQRRKVYPDPADLMTGDELSALMEQLDLKIKSARSGEEVQELTNRFLTWLELEQLLLA